MHFRLLMIFPLQEISRVVGTWNFLSEYIRRAASVSSFKVLVKKFFMDKYILLVFLLSKYYYHDLILLLLLLLLLLLSLLSKSLLVFLLCLSRAQTMHLGHQSLKSIILFIH